ncbi:hypothetical protein L3Y34_006810 [Caenorhabditis briggsae]|uniref:rRNA biogenesis protein RRP36 n=1 Tax=Caenorhabditis briggsae TaxID=6238 RepID=A0AAE9A2C2_CAEBR|nr:hypothetical protein L3Y34_006810 [Caenorhabditis briggsae]
MRPDDHRKFGTFPAKPGSGGPGKFSAPKFTEGNKFQQMATFNKQQEQSGDFRGAPQNRKIHFGGTPKMQYREGGKFYKPPPGAEASAAAAGNFKDKKGGKFEKRGAKSGKFGDKKGGKFDKKAKGDPVKGTSTEYEQLGNSDEDDDVIDVSDMFEKEEEEEVPMINSAKNALKSTKKSAPPPVAPSNNRFAALADDDDVEDDDEEEPKPKKKKTSADSDEEDSEALEEDESEEDDEEERLKFREEIAQMPLGKVKEMKEKLGIKLFNKTYFGASEVDKKRQEVKKVEKSAEKGGQHRPKEISSKRPVSAFRNIYGDHEKGTKKRKWDPRFDSRAGDFKEVCFENNYQFLDEIRTGEMQDLRNEYSTARAEGDEHKAARLKNTLQKMETREKTRAEKRRQAETRKELHDDNIERMLRGEAPIFRTKAQVRRIDAEKKYEELKKGNKLDKYLQKKAKKESAKQKKARPPFEGYGYGN